MDNYCKPVFIKPCFLIVIGLILCSYNLALGETADGVDSSAECPEQLISVRHLKIGAGLIINTFEARFRKDYYPIPIQRLYLQLEYLIFGGRNPVGLKLKTVNGQNYLSSGEQSPVILVLKTVNGQLDLLESSLTITITERSNEQAAHHSRELKYSLLDVFADKLGLKNIEFSYRTVLRSMRLVIMNFFPKTFSDFINGQAIDSSVGYASLGLHTEGQRKRFLRMISDDLNKVKVEEHWLSVLAADADLRDDRLKGEKDFFKNLLLTGHLAQMIEQ